MGSVATSLSRVAVAVPLSSAHPPCASQAARPYENKSLSLRRRDYQHETHTWFETTECLLGIRPSDRFDWVP